MTFSEIEIKKNITEITLIEVLFFLHIPVHIYIYISVM